MTTAVVVTIKVEAPLAFHHVGFFELSLVTGIGGFLLIGGWIRHVLIGNTRGLSSRFPNADFVLVRELKLRFI